MATKKKLAKLSYRTMPMQGRADGAKSFDAKAGTIDFTAATENPVRMWDWEHGEVDEVLLMSGCQIPANRQIPFLDTHSRYSVSDVIGSARALRIEGGELVATTHFSDDDKGQETLRKYADGHLTDSSIGYRVDDSTFVPKGEKAIIGGRSWTGPTKVVTSWVPRELSACPIGADEDAKARAEAYQHTQDDGENEMDKRLRKTLEKRGLDPNATDDEAWAFLDTLEKRQEHPTTPNPPAKIDPNDTIDAVKEAEAQRVRDEIVIAKGQVARQERARVTDIYAMGETFDLPELADKLVADNTPLGEAHTAFNRQLRIAAKDGEGLGFRVQVGVEDREKHRVAAEEGLLIRSGIMHRDKATMGSELANFTCYELARDCLRMANQSIGLTNGDKQELFARALSTSDFDNILANVTHKAVLDGFEEETESYTLWADTSGVAQDFKAHEFSRASEAPDLQDLNSNSGEYVYGNMSDKKESVTVADKGIILKFTRKAMVNDDLGELIDHPRKLGIAANRKYGDMCYAVLTGIVVMGDSNNLWDNTNHSNNPAAGAAPSIATLNAGNTAMATQKDIQGLQNLNIRPVYLLAPWILKGTVDGLLHDTNPVVVGANTKNPWSHLVQVNDARLDTASATAWYLAGRKGMTVKLFTLNGQLTPFLESQAGWAIDGLETKCRVSAAAKAMDWVGLFKNNGI